MTCVAQKRRCLSKLLIESTHGTRVAKNNPRDDGIVRKFGSGCPFWGPSTNIDCKQSIFSQSKFGGTGESEMAERETGERLLAVFYD